MALRDALVAREPLAGTWISIGHEAVAEIAGGAGFDFAVVDTEHTSIGLETVENLVRAVNAAGDTATVVRVPWNDPVRIKRVLDIGVDDVLVPMVETASEARDAVSATRYPPEGVRGLAPARASSYGRTFESYVASANDEIATIVQIETIDGVENATAIAAVDGVDALFVGPADLSSNLGVFGETGSDDFENAVSRIVSAAHGVDIPVGTITLDPADVDVWLDRGMDFLVTGFDAGLLVDGQREALESFQKSIT